MPSFSLANGMWVGDVPFVLRVLTLPEHVLVARYFPQHTSLSYIPKKGAQSWPSSSFHSGRLNTDDIMISTERLHQLPVDGIPRKIFALAKHSDDVDHLAEECDGCVPEDFADDSGTFLASCFQSRPPLSSNCLNRCWICRS
jgi:hypothetical protein